MPRARTFALVLALLLAALLAVGVPSVAHYKRTHPRLTFSTALPGAQPVNMLSFVGDGQGLALRRGPSTWEIRSAVTGELLRTFKGTLFAPRPRVDFLLDLDDHLELIDPWTLEKKSGDLARRDPLAVSPGGDQIAFVPSRGTVELRSTRGAAPDRSFVAERSVAVSGEFSPGGEWLALTLDDPLKVIVISTTTIPVEAPLEIKDSWIVGFTASGELLTRSNNLPHGDGSLVATNPVTGKSRTILEHVSRVIALASGRSDRLASVLHEGSDDATTGKPRVAVVSLTSNEVLREIPVQDAGSLALALSPDGDQLAIRLRDGTIEIWDIR